MPRGTYRSELAKLLILGGPLAATQMGHALLGVVDVAVLGRAGPNLLAGVGLGSALYFGIGVLGMGIMHGLDPMVSQALGAGDPGRARSLVWQGVWLALGLSIVLALPVALSPHAVAAVGVPADVIDQAARFLRWRALSLPFFFLYFAPRALLQAQNRLRPMLLAVVLANAVNLGLDLLLIFGGGALPAWAGPLRSVPALGVVGSAWASNVASAVQVLVLWLAVRPELRIPAPGARAAPVPAPDRRDLRLALRIGLPAGLHMCAEVNFFSALGSTLAGLLGEIPLGAHMVALQLASLTFTAMVGLGNAGSVRVGLAVGACDRAGARRAGVVALAAAASFMACCALVFLAFPARVARLMTDDAQIISAAVPLLRIAAAFQLFDGLQGVGAGILRGAGQTRFTFAVNMIAYWAIGLPVVLLTCFGLGWGIAGLWTGFVVSLAVVASSLVWRFLRVSSRDIAPLRARA